MTATLLTELELGRIEREIFRAEPAPATAREKARANLRRFFAGLESEAA